MFKHDLLKKPKDLESYVQYVYSTLLNLKDEGVVVGRNSTFVGKSDAKHEIDVFYQFERGGVTHRVAFECKFTGRKVPKSDVANFHSKLRDIGNLKGVFVSKSGYQSGAIAYAKYYGIQLLKLEDLPTINILVANRLRTVALPDESYIGEPFWVLMEEKEEALTGNYWARDEGRIFKTKIIPLFISKSDASVFLSSLVNKQEYVVRGVPQHSLKFLLHTADMPKGRVKFSLMLTGPDERGMWPGAIATPQDVLERFYIDNIST